MVDEIIDNMTNLVSKLKDDIKKDIEDIKEAKHQELLLRNDEKHELINNIVSLKGDLNNAIVEKMQEGVDVNIYREKVDNLEEDLKELYELNKKLASLVLPIQKMYKELVDDLTEANGGQIFDIKA